ncbi:uncharacterized protein [Ptychodera flava]|uniref:uncharacterized protein n=1 Tax=Ptychodera flava TaxID=63121 RepID=UPI00396A7F7D
MPISSSKARLTKALERKPKKRRAEKPKEAQIEVQEGGQQAEEGYVETEGEKLEETPLEDIGETSSDVTDDDASTSIDDPDKLDVSDGEASALDGLKRKWRCIAFVLFIVGLLCGSFIVGIIIRLSFDKKLNDAHKSLTVCEDHLQACRHRVHRYSNVYGPVDIQDGCKNYVYDQCEVVKNSTIECHDLKIYVDGDEPCVRPNNETITCGDVTMATNCT